MKISLKWLNEYVDVSEYFSQPEKLGEKLTRAGLEVEELVNLAQTFNNVVVGHILVKEKHPQADKLSLCQVSTGSGGTHQIVCGAQNHQAGDKVIVALPGAVLPGNFQIKKSAIRGVESLGMLCSLKELGLRETSEGIEILPADAEIGKNYAEYAGLDDVTFELKVTPNRADCLSHYGLAREVSCLIEKPLKKLNTEFASLDATPTQEKLKVEVKDSALCPRYTGRGIQGLSVGPSPLWLSKRLESVGMKSINNVVDVTNFVMMELGQPLHAFDADQIQNQKLVIEKANAGEKFKTLDGTDKVLTGEELSIKDSQGTLCVAGVIGGLNSGVSEKTKKIFLESAYFLPMSVRKTSRSLGVETDSAYRFSRGVDPEGALQALNRATQLILQVAGGEANTSAYDIYPAPVVKKIIHISMEFISQRLGYVADENLFVQMMKSLGCTVAKHGTEYQVLPPSFRFDLEQDMDLVEEYARLFGYEHIPEALPALAAAPSFHDKKYLLTEKVSNWMIADGFQRAFNFAFTSGKEQAQFLGARRALQGVGLSLSEKDITLLNPLSEDLNVMRSTLSFGLYKNMLKNFHSGNHEGRLFETGSAFSNEPMAEHLRLAGICWGHSSQLWEKSAPSALVLELKASVEALLKKLQISAFTWVKTTIDADVPGFCHPGQFAGLVVEGKKVGFIATLHPSLNESEKIRVPVALMELNLEQILQGQPRPLKVQTPSQFQVVERDFSFLKQNQTAVGDILKEARKAAAPYCVQADIFDLFSNDKIPQGFESVSLRVWLQDKDGTLQENQILEIQQKIVQSLQKNCSVTLR